MTASLATSMECDTRTAVDGSGLFAEGCRRGTFLARAPFLTLSTGS